MTLQPMVQMSTKTRPAAHRIDALQTALERVEALLHDVVDSDVTVLRDASRHILSAGGKRIRPRLALLSHFAVGGHSTETLERVAAALELVHTASVVHDDINDHGVLRRGRPSVNALWGRTFALLTGDYLFTKVYELMSPLGDLNVPFAEATLALVEGETLQAQAVKENNFTRETYYQIIARKTAALFRAAGYLGAVTAGASADKANALGNYGFNVGLAFQIVDDILDVIGDEKKLGKTAGIDMEQGRGYVAAHANGVDESDPMASIKRKIMNADALAEARQKAQMLVEAAVSALDTLPESAAKSGLIDLAYQVIDREF